MNKERVLIDLSAENDLFWRTWTLVQVKDGYYLTSKSSQDDDFFMGYIPTKKALAYLEQAKNGTLPVSLLCCGADMPERDSTGAWVSHV